MLNLLAAAPFAAKIGASSLFNLGAKLPNTQGSDIGQYFSQGGGVADTQGQGSQDPEKASMH